MQYEIDFLPVGEGSKGGDAITLRYGDFSDRNKYKVVVIDGGTKSSGEALAEHIKTHYNTECVDVVIATHLHQDHISGLFVVLEELQVGKLVMNIPWKHTQNIKKMTKTEMSIAKLEEKLEKSLNGISELEDLAISKKIPIQEVFAGDYIFDELLVLGPSKQYYEELVADFTDISLSKKIEKAVKKLAFLAKEAIERIEETLHIDTETLTDDYEDTDAENNSSLVLFLQADQKRILFTGDVGKEGLKRVIEFADNNKINISEIDILDIPHHGSKRNLGPTILNRLKPKKACISCPKEGDPKHPSRKVVNALIRRGADVLTTKGSTKCYKHKTETRSGWTTATLETFHSHVED